MLYDFKSVLNIALLIWGAIFCIVVAIILSINKNYNKERKKWMLYMQVSTAILLISDAFAWGFRGQPGDKATYILKISNFLVFLMTDITLLLFQQHLFNRMFEEDKTRKEPKLIAAGISACISIVLVIVSQFTNLYYYFDANNYYHRNTYYIISVVFPMFSMLMDLSLLVEYRQNIRKKVWMALVSYIVLPVSASIIQTLFYGFSLTNFAIAVSMIIMFITMTGEQDDAFGLIYKRNEETTDKLEIASTLNQCFQELSSNSEVNESIHNLLKIINAYFDSDRSYIFEINANQQYLVNTYEYVRGRVTAQKENLQEVPVDVISVWMEAFKKGRPYRISNLEKEKGTPTYDMLVEQDVYCLLAVPLMKEEEVIGFLGVDNPRNHKDDATLLSAIQFFITSSLERKREKEYLEYLSFHDKLTGLFNRNSYIELIGRIKEEKVTNTGIASIDLNGLKKENDEKGHAAGDDLIMRTGAVMNRLFFEQSYRTGGDEFLIVATNINEKEFNLKMKLLKEQMKEANVSVSVGFLWKEEIQDLEEDMKIADASMYEEKQKYYNEMK